MDWLDKLERKFGRHTPSNIMFLIVILMGVVYGVELIFNTQLTSLLYLDMGMVLKGQVWRLLSFIILPPASSGIFFTLLAIYFYYFVGNALEKSWGSFRFNVYYLFGIIGTIIAAAITGTGVNIYLNLSLFLAFAMLYPNMQVMLFFIIPIKVKWLAWLNGALFIYQFIISGWGVRASIIASLVNFIIFFGPDFIKRIRHKIRYRNMNKYFKR